MLFSKQYFKWFFFLSLSFLLIACGNKKENALQSKKDVEELEQQEKKNELHLTKLCQQAEKMWQELSASLTGGVTIDVAVEELKKIKEQKDQIEADFEAELKRQKDEITTFYDKRIAKLTAISPRDTEFETWEDYKTRLAKAEKKANPLRNKKRQKLADIDRELATARDIQIKPFEKKISTLQSKRFTASSSGV